MFLLCRNVHSSHMLPMALFLALLSFSICGLIPAHADWVIEYDIGGGSKPSGITFNGTVWFTTEGETRSVIGNVDPATGKIAKYYLSNQTDLRDLVCGPKDLTFSSNSNATVWFVQKTGNRIGRLDPRTGEMASWVIPTAGSTPLGIAIYRYGTTFNNTLFFTEQEGNRIGAFRFTGVQGQFQEFPLPTQNSRPVDIAVDQAGYVWFTESAIDRIGRLDPRTGMLAEYPVLEGSSPWGITVDSAGFVWFTMPEARRIAKLDPRSGFCDSYVIPIPRSKPRHIRADSQGMVWFTEYDAGKVVKYVPDSDAFIEYGLPNSECGPDEIMLGSQNEIWITEQRAGRIGRVTPSVSATVSTSLRTSGIETATSTTFTTQTTASRLTVLTYTTSTMTTATITAPTTIMSTATTTMTTSTTSTTTTTTTAPTITTTLTVTTSARPCIIASAAYGSELAAPVQFLRDFRDGQVAKAFAGSSFLKAFNAFYYSFSPTIAGSLERLPAIKQGVRTMLYPMIGALHISSAIYSTMSFNPEFAITVSGIIASGLIGLTYLTPIIVAFMCWRHLSARCEAVVLRKLGNQPLKR